ncbi:MAG: SAM-dependent methyltransferase, partial [Deltaproteobacteria bacterium]
MDQYIRNKLRGVVTQCRKLLEDSTAQALQGRFGIYAARKKGDVQIEDEARMAHLTEEDRACRQDLLDHLEHIQAIGYKPSEALEQLVREIAFTHLNRLCAYKMMEARGLIREAVSRGLKSQGFFFYLSDHPEDEKLHNGGGQETAYRNFLDWLGGTLSQEIGVLFNPNDPANRIYPPQRVLDEVLALINDGELKDIWSIDETIGWVYQYFTPKELRDKARKESQAPRNSYELAFRNQFFTPRYVVEFLTDNTLGRIWYEMTQGQTGLKDFCRYLVRRPTEIFLKPGEAVPVQVAENENLS